MRRFFAVIPAQAGIQRLSHPKKEPLDSGLRRNDAQAG
jgi:hypothetical protein